MDINQYRLDHLIIRETAERIIKDFDAFGCTILFSGNEKLAYEELTSQLVPFLSQLVSKDKQRLMQVLYRVDISEFKLNKTCADFPKASLAEIIAHLVIEREMQKVITRRLYSK